MPHVSFYSLIVIIPSFSPPPLENRDHIRSSAALYSTSAFHTHVGKPCFFSPMPCVLCALFTDPQPFVIELFHQMSEKSITRGYAPSLIWSVSIRMVKSSGSNTTFCVTCPKTPNRERCPKHNASGHCIYYSVGFRTCKTCVVIMTSLTDEIVTANKRPLIHWDDSEYYVSAMCHGELFELESHAECLLPMFFQLPRLLRLHASAKVPTIPPAQVASTASLLYSICRSMERVSKREKLVN